MYFSSAEGKSFFSSLSFQMLGRNSVCSFCWCYLINRMKKKTNGIYYKGCSLATFCFVPYNLLSIKKSTTNQTPTKTDYELKKLPYFGSGLCIILTDPARTRLLFKLSHFCRMGSLKPMYESGISNRSATWLAGKKILLSKRKKCEWQIQVIWCILELFFWKKITVFYFLYFRNISKCFQESEPTKFTLCLVEVSTYVWKLLWLRCYLEKVWLFSIF